MTRWGLILAGMLLVGAGCATQKESHTPRTGIEQLLISSAVDRSLDQIDLSPVRQRRAFLETKYLDCVDKNYIIVSLRDRLLKQGTVLVDKADAADVIVEVASGGVGTDGEELLVGTPEIPLPAPSPISIPRLSLLTRKKLNGTAKLLVVAYEAKSKTPLLGSGTGLARSDHNNWNVLGTGNITTGSVPAQLAEATNEFDLNFLSAARAARQLVVPTTNPANDPNVKQARHEEEQPAGEKKRK